MSLEHEVLETNKKLEQEIQLIKQILEKPQDEERKDEEKKTVF